MLVHQILAEKPSDKVLIIAEDATIGEAAAILSERRIGCLVVSPDGERVNGIISERDIVREVGRRGSPCLSEVIATVMTREITTCRRDDTSDRLMELMTEGRFRHLPVRHVDLESGEKKAKAPRPGLDIRYAVMDEERLPTARLFP